ncbi:isoprenyl transferase [Roseibium aquae]|uniref:Isoprenyl transferase n=1 Tax=Roseibium aquae TaxID=1323746 RepID=A0A916X351_9HYPH|nr:isoprenyl transferase [Roseibium aquae]GGB60386.1 isoprenyl transferase [Roseibium aquae]
MTAIPERLQESVDPVPGRRTLPRHVAFIMDGNGRWAKARGLPRTEGHRRGLEALRETVRHAGELGIEFMTIYSFSSENWNRPETEVNFLMGLLRRFLQRDLSELHKANIHIRVVGERNDLEPGIRRLLEEAEAITRHNSGMTLVVAFNYGGRNELVRAAQRLAAQVASGAIEADDIDENAMAAALDTAGIPDPDLLIRTSGELRLSNFLLWQSAYTEFHFTPVYWPDFDASCFDAALEDYYGRDRRYGGLTAQVR